MVKKPVVFISSTSDLRTARGLVADVFYSMGYEPVRQDIEPTDGGELLDVLRRRINPCALVVQLVGQRYGAEPPAPTPEFGRVSFTQFEALYAEKLGRKVIYHFIDPAFPTDPAPPESDERRELQAAYRKRIEEANKLWQDSIVSAQDLELSIRRIAHELAAIRTQADRRFRKILLLAGSAAVGIALVAALVLVVLHRQAKTEVQVAAGTSQVKDELSALRDELRAAVAPRPLAQGRTTPELLPPALIEKAKVLLARGDAEDQALAKIALNQHAEADRIIQDLKHKPGNPIDEAYRLFTMEGDNWYQAGEPDRAIGPYEQALALRPTDVAARNNATIAHTAARLGSIAAHQRRAIEIAEGTLKLDAPGSAHWAMTQNNLGAAWQDLPTGDPGENRRKAIAAYEAALTVRTRDTDPAGWAATQINLGNAWCDTQTGDRGENLHKAIAAFDAALAVYARNADLTSWARTQNNLGVAWSDVPTGDRGENLRKSIAAYEAALTVFTKDTDPANWAMTQNNLGTAWGDMPTGDRGENLRRAIVAFEAALTVRTRDADPIKWARTQNNIGSAWCNMPAGDQGQNLRNAIAALEAALAVYTRDADPAGWAMTQYNLAGALAAMAYVAGEDRRGWLARAIASDKAALLVYTAEAYPRDHADAEENMGIHVRAYVAAGGAATRPLDAIAPAP